MNERILIEKKSWLEKILASQRNNLAGVLHRVKALGLRMGNSLALHRKFEHLMTQVAFDREKELDLINEIEAIEKKHLLLKERQMLRRADADKAPRPANDALLEQSEEKPKRGSLLGLVSILALLSPLRLKHKNQDLTVD